MKEQDLDVKLSKLMGLSDQIDEKAAELKALNAEYDELNWELTQYFQQTNMQAKKIFGKNFFITSRTFTKVEDPVKFEEWVEKNNAYKLVMARNANKINAFVEEAMTNGQEIPEGVVPGFVQHSIRIGKA